MIDNCTLPIGLVLGGVSSELGISTNFSIVLGFTR